MAPFRALDWNCRLVSSPSFSNLERQVWRGKESEKDWWARGREGMRKKQGLWKQYREWERGGQAHIRAHMCLSTHTYTMMPRCEVRELVINEIFTRFHNLLYSFLPSARDLCIHHILAALTLFLWFHICSSTDIQDVQFVLLYLSGTQRGGDVEEPV